MQQLSAKSQVLAGIVAFACALCGVAVGCTSLVPATHLSPKTIGKRHVTIHNSIGMEFVYVPAGQFRMGHSEHRKPVSIQRVDGFWMSKYEVTNEQFEQLNKHIRAKESAQDNMPATAIWRTDAEDFAKKLSEKEKRQYRLPKEKEWEYAARGGYDGVNYPWGSAPLDGMMNSGTNSATPVGHFPPNPYGLCDMTGNASEYVQDDYWDDDTSALPTEPKYWMVRGGSFSDCNGFVWYAEPMPVKEPREIYTCNGFRLVLDAPPPKP